MRSRTDSQPFYAPGVTARASAALCSAVIVLAFAACGGSSSGSKAKDDNGPSPSHGANDEATVPVSAQCAAAMKAWETIIQGGGSDADEMVEANTSLTACVSRAEWLTAVRPYTGSGINNIVAGNADPSQVLNGFCNNGADPSPACH
jgi:hypothetical protein